MFDRVRWSKKRVGLLGGSFNPPHAGHIHNSEVAIKYLGLDAVWWLVTPGNPLKSKVGLPSVHERVAQCRDLVVNPRILISDIETELGTTRTHDTIQALQAHFPDTQFVWLAGTEIAHEFSRWYKWKTLLFMLPFAFVGRPTRHGVVRNTVFHRTAGLTHVHLLNGGRPELKKGRIYWIFSETRHPLSSTQLRAARSGFAPTSQKV